MLLPDSRAESGSELIVFEQVFLWGQAPRPKGAEPHRSQNFGVLIYLCLHPLTQNDHVRHGMGGVYFLEAYTPPTPRRAKPQRPPISGFRSIYVYTLRRRTTKFGVITHMGGLVFPSATPSIPRDRGPSEPRF